MTLGDDPGLEDVKVAVDKREDFDAPITLHELRVEDGEVAAAAAPFGRPKLEWYVLLAWGDAHLSRERADWGS